MWEGFRLQGRDGRAARFITGAVRRQPRGQRPKRHRPSQAAVAAVRMFRRVVAVVEAAVVPRIQVVAAVVVRTTKC